jgi:sec-independent protein translocase protein TatC
MGLGHIGWVRASDLRRFRRMAIVACFVIGAVVTPPDIISQLVLALPLWGFYEVSVVLVGYLERRGRAAEEEKHA